MSFHLTTPFQSKQLIEGINTLMKEGLLVLNSENKIEIVNNAGLKLFGFTASEELKGKHIIELYADHTEAENLIRLLELNDHLEHGENIFIRSDGQTFVGSYSGLRIQDPEDSHFSKVVLIRDISEQRISKQKIADYTKLLEKSNKELDQFSYIVSHDLKAPLRAISNLSVWLQEDLGPALSDENKKNLDMLRGRVLRLESLINGILEYSKIGSLQMESEAIDVYTLLAEVVEMLCPPSHIQVHISNKMPVLEAPKIMLLQVFSNLIGNAIKYNNKAQGIIKVYCSEKEHYYEFVVEDNGPGIPSEFFEQIFVIFQTLQSRDKFESSGIGLTIVKRIVDEQGGKIRVESVLENGSKFIFNWLKQRKNHKNSKCL